MRPLTRSRAVVATAAALAASTALPAFAMTASHSHDGASAAAVPALTGSIPAWARGLRSAAAEPAGAPVDIAVVLRGRNQADLAQRAAAVSTPGSASYRQFLTSQQYAARYAPSRDNVAAVQRWLRASGLSVDATSPDGDVIGAHGTAATVGSALHVSFTRVRHDGALRRVPTTQPSVPAALRSAVVGVTGLTESVQQSTAAPAPAFFNARPCSKYFGQKTGTKAPKYRGKRQKDAVCGYTPHQIRSAYSIAKTHLTGKGVTVGIVDAYAAPHITGDTNTYSHRHGLPKLRSGQLVQHTNGAGSNPPEISIEGLPIVDPQGWSGEETLDVEAVHTIAPKARIDYFAASSNVGPGLFMSLNQAVESGEVQVVSNSWGTSDDAPDPTEQAMLDSTTKQARTTGVTIDFSSGDSGDETDPSTDGARTADFPATSPGVTAVGGTTLAINHKGHRAKETYWGTRKTPVKAHHYDFANTVFAGAGGGGVSTTYAEPSWQKHVVPAAYATHGGVPAGRVEPDVAMDADSTTGFLVGQTQTPKSGKAAYSEYRIGGTSLSCPLFSGLVALAVQSHHGKGLGLITPALYKHSRTASSRTKLFHDPSGVHTAGKLSTFANVRPDYTDTTDKHSSVTFSLRTLGNLATLHNRKGYDDSTGLGVPKAAAIVKLLG